MKQHRQSGSVFRHIQLTELQMDHTYGIIMKVITYTLVMFIIPFFILIIVNSRIVIALRRSTNLRRSHLASTTSSNDALVVAFLRKIVLSFIKTSNLIEEFRISITYNSGYQ